jgi:hypothetical protein
MARYICTGKTYHFPKLFRVGDIYNGSAEGLPKDKKGEIRGFRLLEGDAPAKPATSVAVKVNEKVAGETEVTEEPGSTKATGTLKAKVARPKKRRKRVALKKVAPKEASPLP